MEAFETYQTPLARSVFPSPPYENHLIKISAAMQAKKWLICSLQPYVYSMDTVFMVDEPLVDCTLLEIPPCTWSEESLLHLAEIVAQSRNRRK